ncbi:hypothetical protein BpHYR1_023195, partial [Brachionus plicatilis]
STLTAEKLFIIFFKFCKNKTSLDPSECLFSHVERDFRSRLDTDHLNSFFLYDSEQFNCFF